MRLTVLMCASVCALTFAEVVSGATILDLAFDETGTPQAVGSYSSGALDAVLGTDATVEPLKDPTGRVDIGSVPLAVPGTTPAVLDYAGNRVMQFQGDAGGDWPQVRTDASTTAFNFSGNKFTIQMWLNVDDMSEISGVRLVERNAGYSHWELVLNLWDVTFSYVQQGGGRKNFTTANRLFGGVETGVWKHVAFTFDADNEDAHFYFDGVNQALSATLPADVLPIDPVGATYATIGSSRQWNNKAFRGYMDEVRIDERVIDPNDPAFGYTNRIPEPATLALLGVGGVMLVQWRRARR